MLTIFSSREVSAQVGIPVDDVRFFLLSSSLRTASVSVLRDRSFFSASLSASGTSLSLFKINEWPVEKDLDSMSSHTTTSSPGRIETWRLFSFLEKSENLESSPSLFRPPLSGVGMFSRILLSSFGFDDA